jgi:hypothetical protein
LQIDELRRRMTDFEEKLTGRLQVPAEKRQLTTAAP